MKTLTNPSTMKGVNAKLAETEQNKLKNRYVNILPCKYQVMSSHGAYECNLKEVLPTLTCDSNKQ